MMREREGILCKKKKVSKLLKLVPQQDNASILSSKIVKKRKTKEEEKKKLVLNINESSSHVCSLLNRFCLRSYFEKLNVKTF